MVGILLGILKVIGIILLIILGLVLFCAVAIIFIPVRYKAKVKNKEKNFSVNGAFYWFFHIVHVDVSYTKEVYYIKVRLFGIPLQFLSKIVGKAIMGFQKLIDVVTFKNKKDEYIELEENSGVEITTLEVKEDSLIADGFEKKEHREKEFMQYEDVKNESETKKDASKKTAKEKKKNPFYQFIVKIKKIYNNIKCLPQIVIEKYKQFLKRFKKTCKLASEWKEFLTHDKTKTAIGLLKKQAILIIKHINPRKIKGEISFGFEDPSITGQVLGILGMLYPFYGENIAIYPHFEEQLLDVDLFVKGRIQVFYLIKIVWKLYRDDNIKFVMKKFKA